MSDEAEAHDVSARDRLVLDAIELAHGLAVVAWGPEHPAARALTIVMSRSADRLAKAAKDQEAT